MRHHGKTINVESNKLTIVAQQNSIFVYHSYNYKINDELLSGRWYNTKYPLNVFKNLNNNHICFDIENYEFHDEITGPVNFIMVFSEKAATVLRNFLMGMVHLT